MIYIAIFLFLFNFFSSSLLCLPSPYPILPFHINLMAENTYKTLDHCNFTMISPKKVLNPYKLEIKNIVSQKPFSSFHLKCAACLAVADQIGKTIEDCIAESQLNNKSQNIINDDLSLKITTLCIKGFKNYDLRKYNENSLVTDKFKCTEHVKSGMDGNWTKKLRELCNLYISYMDLNHISNNYANKTTDITKHLCSGSGIFRDCQNIETNASLTILEELQRCKTCSCQ